MTCQVRARSIRDYRRDLTGTRVSAEQVRHAALVASGNLRASAAIPTIRRHSTPGSGDLAIEVMSYQVDAATRSWLASGVISASARRARCTAR